MRQGTRRTSVWIGAGAAVLAIGHLAAGCNSGDRTQEPIYGPGSTGNIGTSTPPVPEEDTEVPTLAVQSVRPSDGARLVDPGAEVLVTFNAPVAPQTLDVAGSVILLGPDGEPIPGTARLVSERTVAFEPVGLLPGGTELTLRLGDTLGSPTVAPLPRTTEVTFTTRSTVDEGALFINEVFAGTADANELPDADPLENQFVEVVNVRNRPLSLRGVVLDTTAVRNAHAFADDLVLPPGGAIVVWARSPARGPGHVQASGGALRLDATSGSRVTLRSTEVEDPVSVDELVFPRPPDVPAASLQQSLTRRTDAGVGVTDDGVFVLHQDAPGAAGPFTPGSMANGVLFPAPSPSP